MSGGGLVEVLREHREVDYVDLGSAIREGCECGWLHSTERQQAAEYPTHVAYQILAWLETVAGDAAVRADVAEELRNVGHCPPSKYAEVAFMDANHAADAAVAALLAAVRER